MENDAKPGFIGWIKKLQYETKLTFRSIPSIVVAFFVISVIAMNILANKTIVDEEWIALDGGIIISWLSFLSMDVVTKHFGLKAANKMMLFAVFTNLLVSLFFFLVSLIPTSTDYAVLNSILGGTWFILLSSTIAFIASGLLNNFLNVLTGRLFKKNPNGKFAFFTRSYVSTFIGQYVDNFVFVSLTFMVFAPIFWDGFHWTLVQCLMCSLFGALLELLMEVIFSPFGYYVTKKWEKDNVGEEYFKYLEENGYECPNNRN